jgi:large subunit ribosomal protein L23
MSPRKAKTAEAAPAAKTAPAANGDSGRRKLGREKLMNVLLAPHMSEKSARVNADNQYVFRVRSDATRTDVKDAVELMFEVKVDSVQVLNQPGKLRRFGRIAGSRPGFKKAYVRLAAGQHIDFAGEVK